jgi:hypothetical protein
MSKSRSIKTARVPILSLREEPMDSNLQTNPTSIKSVIIAQFELVSKEQKKTLAALSDDLVLLESGLDSLCFAIVVARLEDKLGFDPFATSDDVQFPVTFGDFIKFYEDGAR